MFGPPTHRLRGHRGFLLGGLVGLAAVVVFVLLVSDSETTAKASAPPPATYAALASNEPSGLPVAVIGSPTAVALGAKGPVFPAQQPDGSAGRGPLADTIRKLTVSAPDVSAWIAKSAEGGICVLASRHQPVIRGAYGLAISCATAEPMDSGTMLELQNPNNATNIVVGVVPDDVSAVEVTFGDGRSETVPAAGNTWSLESSAQVTNTQTVVGG